MTFKRKIQHSLAVVTLASLPAPLAAQAALPCLTPSEAQPLSVSPCQTSSLARPPNVAP